MQDSVFLKIGFSLEKNPFDRLPLYSTNWLLAYEAKVKDWLPSQGQSDHVDEDAFFGTLKSHNVSFYDSTQQVTPVDSREFGDDEESEDDNYDESEAYYFWY
jgi:hypothetical protein